MFTVGAFGRLAGVSAKVLRSYDAEGLFPPAWVDPGTGYRYYSPAQLPKLRRILALRELGLGRAALRDLVCGDTDLKATLERRRRELDDEHRAIERRLALLDIRLASADGDVVVRQLAAEPVATFDLANAPGDDIGLAFHELESHVRDLGIRAPRPPGAIADEELIFVPVRRPAGATERIGFRRLPATTAATLLHHGRYATLPAAIAALDGWVRSAGRTRTGPLRILYLQFGAEADLRLPRGWTVDHAADFVTELQQPID